MNKYLSALLLLFGAVGWCQTKGARTFDLALPENWKQAKAVVLVFKNLEVPEDRSVVFRVVPSGRSEDTERLGTLSVVAKSRNSKGVRHLGQLEVNLSAGFRRWAETARTGERVSITVKPYAGLREAVDFPWQVGELKLETR